MKLLSFIRADGSKSYGIYKDNGIVDLGLRLGDKYKDIKALLAADALSLVSQYAGEQIDYSADTVRFLPIIESPDKILCVGMNYMAKRQEFDETNNAPTLFVRFPESQTGHACGVVKPQVSNEFDYEGELAVIIGKSGKHIRREEALHYVAGYSCYMDGSVRDWQHSWFTAGKNWQETGAFGPGGKKRLEKFNQILGGNAWTQRPLPLANSPHCAYYPVGLTALDRAGIEWVQAVANGGSNTWRVSAAADLGITILPRGIAQAGLEPVEHGGALPPLPPTWLNVYVADGPARREAAEFAGYLRRAVCEVAAMAA